MRDLDRYLYRRRLDNADAAHPDLLEVLCRPSTGRSMWRQVSKEALQSLVVALVFSRLDYDSATLAGLPKQLLDRLQSVQNAADTRLVNV